MRHAEGAGCPPLRGRLYAHGNCAPDGHGGGEDAFPPEAPQQATGSYPLRIPGRDTALACARSCVLLVLAIGLGVAPASGADGDDEREDGAGIGAVEENVEAADAAEREAKRPPRPPVARDVFVPSEEISEDVEVPFPVDI